MALTRKALWSFLVGTLAAIPVLHGVAAPVAHDPAAAPEVKAEATAPEAETRKVLEEARRVDEVEDAPARVAIAVFAVEPVHVLADADRAAEGLLPADADAVPLSRRALG